VVHGGARLGAMGGGEHGVRGLLTSVRAGVVRSHKGVRGGRVGGPPLGDRVRGLPGHGKAGATRAPWKAASRADINERGSKARFCARLGVRGCWGAPGRKGVAARTVPCASANAATAWRRGHERTTRHKTATRTNELASERASMKAAAPARKHPSLARRPASPAVARGNDAFHLGAKAGASTWGGERLPSAWWPRAEVQAHR
jgi:hypothetical protein